MYLVCPLYVSLVHVSVPPWVQKSPLTLRFRPRDLGTRVYKSRFGPRDSSVPRCRPRVYSRLLGCHHNPLKHFPGSRTFPEIDLSYLCPSVLRTSIHTSVCHYVRTRTCVCVPQDTRTCIDTPHLHGDTDGSHTRRHDETTEKRLVVNRCPPVLDPYVTPIPSVSGSDVPHLPDTLNEGYCHCETFLRQRKHPSLIPNSLFYPFSPFPSCRLHPSSSLGDRERSLHTSSVGPGPWPRCCQCPDS